jgi:hypothetical protein
MTLVENKNHEPKDFFTPLLDTTRTILEDYLLAVYCLSNTSSKGSKFYLLLFKNRKEKGITPAAAIFNNLRSRCLCVLDRRISKHQSIHDTVSLYLLASILSLMANCDSIKTVSILNQMKEMTNVDWELCLNEVRMDRLSNSSMISIF